jgi:hypothetical protein
VDEDDCDTCPDGRMTKLDDEEESMVPKAPCPEDVVMDEKEKCTKLTTLRTKLNYNDANNTPREIGST